jgi:hypothetical protein
MSMLFVYFTSTTTVVVAETYLFVACRYALLNSLDFVSVKISKLYCMDTDKC